jgi:hypothetical protein
MKIGHGIYKIYSTPRKTVKRRGDYVKSTAKNVSGGRIK